MKQNFAAYFYLNAFIFTTLCLCPLVSSAATFTARISGNWSASTTWTPGAGATTTIPGAGDIVNIPGGITVTVLETTQNAACATLNLETGGTGSTGGGIIIISGILQVTTINQLADNSTNKNPKLQITEKGHLKIYDAYNFEAPPSGWVGYSFLAGSKVEYNGTGTEQKILPWLNYRNLILSGQGVKKLITTITLNTHTYALNPSLTVLEDFIITGLASFNASPDLPTAVPNPLHNVTGNLAVSGNGVYNGNTCNMTVAGSVTNGVVASSSAKLNMNSSTLNVAKDFTNNGTANGGVLGQINIGGNWVNNNIFEPGTSTVKLTGSLASISQVGIGGTAETTFHNLTITLPTTPVKSALMTNHITVNNDLSLSNGKLNTGNGTLANYYLITLSSTARLITVETNDSYINGRIASTRTIPASGAQGFGGIAINISRNAVDPGSIKVERITGFSLTDGVDNSVPRYFDVQRVSAGDITGISLTMNFTFLSMEIPPSIDDYVLVRELSPGKFTRPKFTKQSTTTVQNVNSGVFSKYTLAKKIAPLPVDLVWFKAEARGSVALLTWQTAWERVNAGFAVQLSEDGEEFRQVGFVQEGSATKNGAQSYSFVHEDYHKSGTRYYRLAQHDLDGTVTYSPVRVVEIRSEGQLGAYPNPFSDELTVVLPSNAPSSIIIINQIGQEVYRVLSQEALHSISLGASLQSGVYFLTVRTANETYACKLIKR
ncbi:T9SS type A sorting domain-containing protein [Pontibacter sp. MBLB2868]|uniref:T9SS type A sorting domain-containing protein n=1 Tax=Pontibacter sp. MBLB2868 TaxID=3451555 RepID=UPI003F74D44B